MKKYAFNVCNKCKRKDWMSITEEDRNYAKKHGGLFVHILDHGEHLLELHIDINGKSTRKYFCNHDFSLSDNLYFYYRKVM